MIMPNIKMLDEEIEHWYEGLLLFIKGKHMTDTSCLSFIKEVVNKIGEDRFECEGIEVDINGTYTGEYISFTHSSLCELSWVVWDNNSLKELKDDETFPDWSEIGAIETETLYGEEYPIHYAEEMRKYDEQDKQNKIIADNLKKKWKQEEYEKWKQNH